MEIKKIYSWFFLEVECGCNFYVENPKNCHTFYQCVYNSPVLMKCPGELVWNQAIKYCDWEKEPGSCLPVKSQTGERVVFEK